MSAMSNSGVTPINQRGPHVFLPHLMGHFLAPHRSDVKCFRP